ncbi:collagen alpha-1(I) chain-like [Mesoplodon densirostris]|uniref:collagen alpha-1(I) chain-like n=1 Tax=Mesoplodon densirostris TaxID=48708 RepID=UPI0028DC1085|nr:collagen alpha-1(I) chain-like [Mesoplodon densirostris]
MEERSAGSAASAAAAAPPRRRRRLPARALTSRAPASAAPRTAQGSPPGPQSSAARVGGPCAGSAPRAPALRPRPPAPTAPPQSERRARLPDTHTRGGGAGGEYPAGPGAEDGGRGPARVRTPLLRAPPTGTRIPQPPAAFSALDLNPSGRSWNSRGLEDPCYSPGATKFRSPWRDARGAGGGFYRDTNSGPNPALLQCAAPQPRKLTGALCGRRPGGGTPAWGGTPRQEEPQAQRDGTTSSTVVSAPRPAPAEVLMWREGPPLGPFFESQCPCPVSATIMFTAVAPNWRLCDHHHLPGSALNTAARGAFFEQLLRGNVRGTEWSPNPVISSRTMTGALWPSSPACKTPSPSRNSEPFGEYRGPGLALLCSREAAAVEFTEQKGKVLAGRGLASALPRPEPPPPHSRAGDWPKAIQLVRAPPVGLKAQPVRPAIRLPFGSPTPGAKEAGTFPPQRVAPDPRARQAPGQRRLQLSPSEPTTHSRPGGRGLRVTRIGRPRSRRAPPPRAATARARLGSRRSFKWRRGGGVLGLQEDSSGFSAQAARQEPLGAITPRRLPPRSAPGPASGSAGRGAEGPGWPGVRGAGSEGSSQEPPLPALLPGRAWAAPSLSLRAGPPGLVVLNISQLRYRTVELLRTTEPSARSASSAPWREEPRRPDTQEERGSRTQPHPPNRARRAPASPAVPAARPLRPRPRDARRCVRAAAASAAAPFKRVAALPRRRNAPAPRRPDRFFRAGRLPGRQVARPGPRSGPGDHTRTVPPGTRGARLTAGRWGRRPSWCPGEDRSRQKPGTREPWASTPQPHAPRPARFSHLDMLGQQSCPLEANGGVQALGKKIWREVTPKVLSPNPEPLPSPGQTPPSTLPLSPAPEGTGKNGEEEVTSTSARGPHSQQEVLRCHL